MSICACKHVPRPPTPSPSPCVNTHHTHRQQCLQIFHTHTHTNVRTHTQSHSYTHVYTLNLSLSLSPTNAANSTLKTFLSLRDSFLTKQKNEGENKLATRRHHLHQIFHSLRDSHLTQRTRGINKKTRHTPLLSSTNISQSA